MNKKYFRWIAFLYTFVVLATGYSAKTYADECNYIKQIQFPFGVHPYPPQYISHNENAIFFLASNKDRYRSELWLYDLDKGGVAVEYEEVYEAHSKSLFFPIITEDKIYLQGFTSGKGMLEIDTDKISVRHIKSELDLLHTVYESSEDLIEYKDTTNVD